MPTQQSVSPDPNPCWILEAPDEFANKLKKLTRRDKALKEAFKKTIDAVAVNPLRIGKWSKEPKDARHVHVKSHWILWWKVQGNRVILWDCGHYDDFF